MTSRSRRPNPQKSLVKVKGPAEPKAPKAAMTDPFRAQRKINRKTFADKKAGSKGKIEY